MEQLIRLMHSGGYSCVVKNRGVIRTFGRRGVVDLYDLLHQSPIFMYKAKVCDKVVGKASATLLILGGVECVYADVVSTEALALLRAKEVRVQYKQEVSCIRNHRDDACCPLELRCDATATDCERLAALATFLGKVDKTEEAHAY
jgi:iron complex outermembrane receptor protein